MSALPREADTEAGRRIGSLQRPPDRRLAAFILPRQLSHRLAGRVPLGNTPALAGVERSRPAEPGALAPGPLDPLLAALADQAALELRNAAHDRHHQSAYVRCGVAPAFPEGDKATALLLKLMQDVVQVTARSRQTVQLRHHDGVTRYQRLHKPVELPPTIGGLP